MCNCMRVYYMCVYMIYKIYIIRDPTTTILQHPTTEPHGSVVGYWLHGQAIAGSNPALCYLVSPFKKEN